MRVLFPERCPESRPLKPARTLFCKPIGAAQKSAGKRMFCHEGLWDHGILLNKRPRLTDENLEPGSHPRRLSGGDAAWWQGGRPSARRGQPVTQTAGPRSGGPALRLQAGGGLPAPAPM